MKERTTPSPYRCIRTGSGSNDFRLELGPGAPKLVAVPTTDQHGTMRRGMIRDDLLSAVPVGKVLALGTVWEGHLGPRVDATIEAVQPLVTGFTSGRVLRAEPIGKVLDLGTTWVGNLRSEIADVANGTQTAGARADESVDITELTRAVQELEAAFESGRPDQIGDAFKRTKAARDALRKPTDQRRTSDVTRSAEDAGRRANANVEHIQSIQRKTNEFWAGEARRDPLTGRMTGDAPRRSSGASNDLRSINEANAAFWTQQGGNGPKDAA